MMFPFTRPQLTLARPHWWVGLWALAFVAPALAQQQVTIGVLFDGDSAFGQAQVEALEREMVDLMRPEFEPRFPTNKQVHGNWRLGEIRGGLRTLLADAQVDFIVTFGVTASHLASRMEALGKPVIAATVADAELQGFPLDAQGRSGKRNFAYVATLRGIEKDLGSFHSIVGFEHLAVLVDALTLEAVPQLRQRARAIETRFGAKVDVLPVTDSVSDVLKRLSEDVDAVYVTPLGRFDEPRRRALAAGLVERRLPSFALLGRIDVERGFTLAAGGRDDDLTRSARRIALIAQRVLLGEQAAQIEVAFAQSERLAINMRSARAIGFLPRWSVLVDAERIDDVEPVQGGALTLVGAMLEAVDTNLGLRADQLDVEIAEDSVAQARAGLLPQVSGAISGAQIDSDRAVPGLSAERAVDGEVSLSQVIYSEEVRSAFVVSRFLKDSQDQVYRARVLDVFQSAASAYLNVLR
ncbi:MAG: TolC family protein, partial [Pseudomonadota bacterium]